MEMYVIQSKNGIMKNVRVNFKNSNDWNSFGKNYMWNPSTCDCEYDKTCRIGEYLDIKNFASKELVIGKLVLTCEDEILNTTETMLVNCFY